MNHNSEIRRKILQVSSLLIAVGLLGLCIVLNVQSLNHPAIVGLFAVITSAGCVGMILYSTVYVIQKLREDKRK